MRDSGEMRLDESFSDTILFEVPRRSSAASLCRHLRLRWTEWLEEDNGQWIVYAQLRPETGDLAMLLRAVEAWAAERGLEEMWFQLDGRSYLLRSPHVDPSTATAA